MPQNTVLPQWVAEYPILAPAQKPPGVTVLTTATAPRVPNKPTYSAGTIQSYDPQLGRMLLKKIIEKPGVGPVVEEPKDEEEKKPVAEAKPAAVKPEVEEEPDEEEDEDESGPDRTPPQHRGRRR